MKKLTLLIILCLPLMGCSILKWASSPFKNTVNNVPQSKIEAKAIVKCTGELSIAKNGTITCTKGYYSYNNDSNIQERKLSIKEKIIQFFNNLMGISFWLVIGLLFLCPSLIGLIIGRVFNATNTAFTQTVAAIKAFRQKVSVEEKEKLDAFLRASQDDKTKQLVAAERTKVS